MGRDDLLNDTYFFVIFKHIFMCMLCWIAGSLNVSLGRLVDGESLHTVDSKIAVLKNFPTPKPVENVC